MPLVAVEWYYLKCELDFDQLGIHPMDRKHISENELFKTDHRDIIWVNSIQ